MTVKQRKVSELRPHPDNPRAITEARFEQLKRGMAADPEMLRARPIIALPDGTVIAGAMRLRAAADLGWKTIPTVTVDLDEQRAALWALRDNNEYGEWDRRELAQILDGLSDGALDLAGFDTSDMPLPADPRPLPAGTTAEDEEDTLPPVTTINVVVGRYRQTIPMAAFDTWEAALTEKVGSTSLGANEKGVTDELRCRLGFN